MDLHAAERFIILEAKVEALTELLKQKGILTDADTEPKTKTTKAH